MQDDVLCPTLSFVGVSGLRETEMETNRSLTLRAGNLPPEKRRDEGERNEVPDPSQFNAVLVHRYDSVALAD